MAANQPAKKDMRTFNSGVPREIVISEFGAPIHTETENGKKVDLFKFTQGYSQGNKVIRTVGHGTMDVLTLGLWEVIGTPTESTFNGKDIVTKVTYDQNNKVEHVEYLKQK